MTTSLYYFSLPLLLCDFSVPFFPSLFLLVCVLISCSTLDNTSIQCSHGKAPVSKVGFMKRLSTTAWTILFSKVFACIVIFSAGNHFCLKNDSTVIPRTLVILISLIGHKMVNNGKVLFNIYWSMIACFIV